MTLGEARGGELLDDSSSCGSTRTHRHTAMVMRWCVGNGVVGRTLATLSRWFLVEAAIQVIRWWRAERARLLPIGKVGIVIEEWIVISFFSFLLFFLILVFYAVVVVTVGVHRPVEGDKALHAMDIEG